MGRKSQVRKRREKEEDKEDNNFSVCSGWEADLGEQDRENQECEDQKNKDRKTPQTSPNSSSFDTFTHKAFKVSMEQLGTQPSVSPETEAEV